MLKKGTCELTSSGLASDKLRSLEIGWIFQTLLKDLLSKPVIEVHMTELVSNECQEKLEAVLAKQQKGCDPTVTDYLVGYQA